VYNGHYAKAVVHVVIFGGLVTLLGAGLPDPLKAFFVVLTIAFFFYMPIEAFRTARSLQRGEPVDEFSGVMSLVRAAGQSPAVGVVLIAMGIVFLLQSLGYWRISNLLPYWPVTLIALGVYMIYRRMAEASRAEDAYLRPSPGGEEEARRDPPSPHALT
jgi:hypothetical protein